MHRKVRELLFPLLSISVSRLLRVLLSQKRKQTLKKQSSVASSVDIFPQLLNSYETTSAKDRHSLFYPEYFVQYQLIAFKVQRNCMKSASEPRFAVSWKKSQRIRIVQMNAARGQLASFSKQLYLSWNTWIFTTTEKWGSRTDFW